MRAKELLDLGYALSARTGDPPEIQTRVENWHDLSWAHRTALRARLGTDANGQLTITDDQLADPKVQDALRRSTGQPGGEPLTKGSLPGVDDRLKAILDEERCKLREVDYDAAGLHHEGPDASLLYTSENFWGPLNPGYPEIQEPDYADWDHADYGIPVYPLWADPAAAVA